MTYSDFSELLHELRSRELRKMPIGAKVFLSAGCAGSWYFNWINDNYPGIEEHLGIEAYADKPDDLPEEARWLADHVYDMESVDDGSVDLVFAGQTVEHLWPDMVAGFLCEAHRVLKSEGLLVIDSPNRPVTQALSWYQPEHTMEYSVEEIVELVSHAGFSDINVRGVWLCYDYKRHQHLPLVPDLQEIDVDSDERVLSAEGNPEAGFVWWVEARKDDTKTPDRQIIAGRAQTIYHQALSMALMRELTEIGSYEGSGSDRLVMTTGAQRGSVRVGPYIPLRPGTYKVRFHIACQPRPDGLSSGQLDEEALKIAVTADMGQEIVSSKSITARTLICDRNGGLVRKGAALGRKAAKRLKRSQPTTVNGTRFMTHELVISPDEAKFAVEFIAYSTGLLPIVMRSVVEMIELE